MPIPLITLDSKGVIKDPKQKIDRILSHLLTTDKLQSNVHRDSVTSIHDILKNYGNHPDVLAREIQRQLEEVLYRYFDDVEAIVEPPPDSDTNALYTLSVMIRVRQDSAWYDFATTLRTHGDSITKVAEVSSTY